MMSEKTNKFFRQPLVLFVTGLFMSLILVSCAGKQLPGTDTDSSSVEDLEQRVTMLWSGRIDQDWERVYSLMDTAYRKDHSKAAFVESGELKIVHEFKIIDMQPVSENRYEVTIKFKIEKMGTVFGPKIKEKWVFEPGEGWMLDKSGMTGKNPF